MNKNIQQSIFIKNLSNQYFNFYIDNEQNLIFKKLNVDNHYTDSTIIESDVLDFSATIDQHNKLHLLYLIKEGELIYSTYSDNTWEKNLIGKLDTKSNIYKYFNLSLHENQINIFYAFTNLININLWTIEHITKGANNWQRNTVISILSEKTFSPFHVDKDKFGNIYLVYCGKDYNHNHIYCSYYNIFTQRWTPTPTKISTSSINNTLPYLFIDSRNNIHILWYSSNNIDYILNYKHLSSVGQNKYQWQEVDLPQIVNSSYPALMFEKDNKLKIIYIKGEEIFSLSSKDYGKTWNKEYKTSIVHYPIFLIKYYNISLDNINDKINHCYASIDNNNIQFYFGDNSKDDSIINIVSNAHEKVNISLEQMEESNTVNAEVEKLAELKNMLLEIQNELIVNNKNIEQYFTSLDKLINITNNIQNDIEFLKSKLKNIEEKQDNKTKLFRFK
mgnify:CR=1 FL=1